MSVLIVQTTRQRELIDLTSRVSNLVAALGDGLCHVFMRHTTAALTFAALPDHAGEDLLSVLPKLVPVFDFQHAPAEHVPAHILSALIGTEVTIPVEQGRLALGEFQSLVLLEFQGPAERQIEVRFLAVQP